MYFRRHVQIAGESSQVEQELITTDSQLHNTTNEKGVPTDHDEREEGADAAVTEQKAAHDR